MSLLLLAIILIISIFFHYIIQRIFVKYQKFDDINHRSAHNVLATRTGGIGIFLTLLLVCLFYYFKGIELFDYSLFIPLGIMFIVGVYDDLYRADFKLKFLLQIIVAKILIDQGFVISNYYGLFGLYEIPWVLAQLSTIFVFLVLVNAINFIDGIDGLALSEIIKSILLFEFFSTNYSPFKTMSIILISSMLPLYYFNFKKKRKVFLGDSGSLLLGTIASIYVFYVLNSDYEFRHGITLNKTLFVVFVLLYPLVDLMRVFILRIKNNKSPFQPDQNHIHHFLIKRFNSLQSLLIIITVSLMIFCLFFLFTK